MRTVLIFAHECAPFNRPESTIGAQRPAQFAKHLPKFGWRAIVICRDAAQDRCWDRVRTEEIRGTARDCLEEAEDDASVIIPTPSLTHDGVVDGLWHWTRAERDGVKWCGRVLRRPLTTLKFFTGDYSQSWQPCARVAAEEVARHLDIRCCIGEHSPDAGLFLARWFSRTHDVPWLADFRDPALLQHPAAARRIHKPILRWQLRSASQLANVTPFWAELDRADFRRPCSCITNGFDPEEFGNADVAPQGPDVTVVYAGNINAGAAAPFEGLRIFLEGLAATGGNGDRVNGAGHVLFKYFGGSHRLVADMAETFGVKSSVLSSAGITRQQVLREMLKSHILLLISTGKPELESKYYRRGFYPGKVFEYFGARRPILCVPGDGGQLDELISRTATGVILRTPEEVAACLHQAVEHRASGRDLPYEPNSEQVGKYTRQNLAGKLAECLNQSIRRDARHRPD